MKYYSFNKLVPNFLTTTLLIVSLYIHASEDLVQQIDQIRQDHNISAAVVIVVDKNNVLTQAFFGKSSWESNHGITPANMFRIGSISKSFAAILAIRMQQAGLVDLTKPLNHYLKKEYNKNTFDVEITLQQLLEHTSGLPELSKAEWDYNKSDNISIEQALALKLGNHVTQWQPGLHSSYSNVGVGYMGLALEKASGKSYEQLMDYYVFNPMAMKSSTLLLEKHVNNRLIKGYNTDGTTLIPYWHNIYRPFAAINTDAKDMVIFLQMMLNNGKTNKTQFLSATEIDRIETAQTTLAAMSGLQYGYGLANYHWQTNGYTFHGHGGDADGYLSRYGYNRQSGLAYFVMINAFKHKPLKRMRNLIESHITKDLPKPHYPNRLQLSDNIVKKYIGDYQQVTSRFKKVSQLKSAAFSIIQSGKTLYIQYKNTIPKAIYAVNNKHFRYEDESVATIAFIEYKGKIYFQADIGNFVKIE